MNREIKFRAKNKNNNEWYYSYIDIELKQERIERELESREFWRQIEIGDLLIKTLGSICCAMITQSPCRNPQMIPISNLIAAQSICSILSIVI